MKAHIYKDSQGNTIPSVTQVISILSKPALIHWAWKMGIDGLDYRQDRDEKQKIGTLVHQLIMNFWKYGSSKKDEDELAKEYGAQILDKALNSMISFYEWVKNNKIEPILIEQEFVSDKRGFGGTIDLLARLNGNIEIIDFKTGGVYPEHFFQLAGYNILLKEKLSKEELPNAFRIVSIPRDEKEEFTEKVKTNLAIEQQIFLALLKVYKLMKKGKYL